MPCNGQSSLPQWSFEIYQKLWCLMRKMVIAALLFSGSSGDFDSVDAVRHFPNDPKLFSSIEEIRRLTQGPSALHWVVPESEITIGESRVIVLYTSEGSGMAHEFAFVYKCGKSERCILSATAYAFVEGEKRLRHKFDRMKESVTFFHGNQKILTVRLQASTD